MSCCPICGKPRGGGRNDYTRGQEVSQGSYSAGGVETSVTVRASHGDLGYVHAVRGEATGRGHTTAHPDGSFHHHGEHAKGRDSDWSND